MRQNRLNVTKFLDWQMQSAAASDEPSLSVPFLHHADRVDLRRQAFIEIETRFEESESGETYGLFTFVQSHTRSEDAWGIFCIREEDADFDECRPAVETFEVEPPLT